MAGITSTRSASALVLCLSLVASACASDSELSTEATTATAAPATSEATPDASEATPDTTADIETELAQSEPALADESEAMEEPVEPAPAVAFDLPSVELTNVATGEAVDLATVADGKPLVLWFWSPH